MSTFLTFVFAHLVYRPLGLYYLIAANITLSVGLIVLIWNPKSKSHQSFFLMTLTGFGWLFTFGFFILMKHKVDAFTWLFLDYILAVPYISPAVYVFSEYWTQPNPNKKLIWLGWGIAFFFSMAALLYGHEIFDIGYYPWGPYDHIKSVPFFCALQAFFFAYAFLAFNNFFQAWRHARSPQQRIHIRNFLIAFFFGYSGSIDFYVAQGLKVYPFGFLSFGLFILIVAYTIVRHKFLDINFALKKVSLLFLIYSLLFSLLLASLPFFHSHPQLVAFNNLSKTDLPPSSVTKPTGVFPYF